jgi:glutathione S-transferase
MAMLNLIASELHVHYAPLFDAAAPDALRSAALDRLHRLYQFLDRTLEDREFLLGATFSVADAYLFTVTSWAPLVDLDLQRFRQVAAHQQRIRARPAVEQALRSEGLA